MIAVTGANGKLGRLVIDFLLSKTSANNIVALVRTPENAKDIAELGVEVRQGDYDKPETLQTALKGIEKLLLISGSEVGKRVAQHSAVIDAAKHAGVSLLIYTSLLKADKSPLMLAAEHKQTEEAIQASGIPSVILRNGWYLENYTESAGAALGPGKVFGTAGDGVIKAASRKDYAEAAACVLSSSEPLAGQVFELCGDEGFTLEDFAKAISQVTGKDISYQYMPKDDYKGLLVQVGLPEGFAVLLADSEAGAAIGGLDSDSQQLSKLIGRPTTSLLDALKEAL